MKKFLFVMMALVATFAFTACEKSESQVFDLTYDETTGDQAEIMAYQQNYREIFIQELSAVAKPVTEAGTTFVIDGTKSSAVKTATAAFNKAGEKAQQKAGDTVSETILRASAQALFSNNHYCLNRVCEADYLAYLQNSKYVYEKDRVFIAFCSSSGVDAAAGSGQRLSGGAASLPGL